MNNVSEIFEINYNNYCSQIGGIDFLHVKDKLGIEGDENRLIIPFFDRTYRISKSDITDEDGSRPGYVTCVILAKYVLLCPDHLYEDMNWGSFKDFKKTSHFTNLNFFRSDTEHAIEKAFSGKRDVLSMAADKLNGTRHPLHQSYDLSFQLRALPRISLLLLFNDKDEDFGAQCTVLFQKQAEYYLDPESLAMVGSVLAGKLIKSTNP